jgi:hypothetical protein
MWAPWFVCSVMNTTSVLDAWLLCWQHSNHALSAANTWWWLWISRNISLYTCIIKHAGVQLRTKVVYTYLFDTYATGCIHLLYIMKSSVSWHVTACSLFKSIYVSKEHVGSIFKVEEWNQHESDSKLCFERTTRRQISEEKSSKQPRWETHICSVRCSADCLCSNLIYGSLNVSIQCTGAPYLVSQLTAVHSDIRWGEITKRFSCSVGISCGRCRAGR